MSVPRKRITTSNQSIRTYNLRSRGKKQARPSTIVPQNSRNKETKKIKLTSRKNNDKENPNDQSIMPSQKRLTEPDFNKLDTIPDFLRPDELEVSELFKDDETSERCPFCDIILPSLKSDKLKSASELFKKGKISALEFCFIHFAEISVISDGVAKNYPFKIDFDKLPDRIHKFRDDLLEIVNGTADSYYRDYALRYYKNNGSRKSASSMGLLNRFEELRAGYYGTKGTLIISDVLIKLFLTTHILTSKKTAPLKPEDYMMEVLIPETAVRLIYEDNGSEGSLETAREILVSSSDFGDWVHNDGDV